MRNTKENCLLVGKFKVMAKRLGLEVSSSEMMRNNLYAEDVLSKAESMNDLEMMVQCEKIKEVLIFEQRSVAA